VLYRLSYLGTIMASLAESGRSIENLTMEFKEFLVTVK